MFKLSYTQFIKVIILTFFGTFFYVANAQEVRVIDNKGTLKNINKVEKNDTGIKPTVNVVGGDVYIDEKNGQVFIFNGKTSTWTSFTQYWSLKGNTLSGTTAETDKNFLGTKNDVKLQLRSNNLTLLQLGKRSKLYTSTNHDPIVNIRNGGSDYATLEFQADGITNWGKPVIRANNNTFMIRSGIPNSDYFEISTGGVGTNNGTLDFTIGDDGNEAFRFYGYSNALSGDKKIELFRAQGSLDGSNLTKPRFGINMDGNMANSTLQIDGSFSTAITNGTTNLQEEHHTVVLSNASDNVTLPAPATVKGRIYIIRNSTNTEKTIGGGFNYRGLSETTGANSNIIPGNSVLKLQSDGTDWVMINNKGSYNKVYTTINQSSPVASTLSNTLTEGDIWYDLEDYTVSGTTKTRGPIKIYEYKRNNAGVVTSKQWKKISYKGKKGSVFFAGDDGYFSEDPQFHWYKDAGNFTRLIIGERYGSVPDGGFGKKTDKLSVNGTTRSNDYISDAKGDKNTPAFRFKKSSNTGMFLTNTSSAKALGFTVSGTHVANAYNGSTAFPNYTASPTVDYGLDVKGRLRIGNVPNEGNGQVLMVSYNGLLVQTSQDGFHSKVTSKIPHAYGQEIATHVSGEGSTIIRETVTKMESHNNGLASERKNIASYTNELNIPSGSAVNIYETVTAITQATNNTATATVNISLPNQTVTQTTKTIATYKNENTATTTINETVTSLVQDTTTNTATSGNIYYNNEAGKTYTATVVSKDTNNSIKVGSDGGAYLDLGAIVHVGHFTVSQNKDGTVGDVTVTGLPFRASKITFVAQPNVHMPTVAGSTVTETLGQGYNNGSRIIYHTGTMNGYVNLVGNTIKQGVVSHTKALYGTTYYRGNFSSNEYAIGFNFINRGGHKMADFMGRVIAIGSNSFTIHSVFKYQADSWITDGGYDSSDEDSAYKITVMYVAYK